MDAAPEGKLGAPEAELASPLHPSDAVLLVLCLVVFAYLLPRQLLHYYRASRATRDD